MMMMSSGEMCSFFYQSMESAGVQGDLGDVVRGGGSGGFVPSIDTAASPSTLRPIKPAPPAAPLVSAPRAPAVKRRKGQAKRVICIPAPAADQESPSKSGGVVVPSDLWAWRKYGQKPIKGSPYPRGYYRCSSSKGCPARKQVERSRTDPNLLVITYTSEHNHPWPTHRNSLAGSTRSQPSKNSNKQAAAQSPNIPSTKQEQDDQMSPSSSSPPLDQAIKEEGLDIFDRLFDPMMLETKDMGFFDELGGLDPDPMGCFFSSRELKLEDEIGKACLDPLSYFDWDGN